MQVKFDLDDPESYKLFLRVKSLPRYKITGRVAEIPDDYAHLLGATGPVVGDGPEYVPEPWMFDYQAAITALAVRRKRFAIYAECGVGKTACLLSFARHASAILGEGRKVLIVSPVTVIPQTIAEAARFFGSSLPIERVRARDLQNWLLDPKAGAVGITNYEALSEGLKPGRLGAIIVDESSVMKSQGGAWGRRLVELGKGIDWKLCLTGTPAPNDRIEYATTAVFLDQYPTLNAFLARYFVNRGQTDNRWEMKPHALRPFYRDLSHWCIFLTNPAVYGWKDNVDTLPPVNIHVVDVPLTPEQQALIHKVSGDLYGTPGGIGSRSKVGQLAKGRHEGKDVPTNKPGVIRDLVRSWPDRSTVIWCIFNAEQELLEKILPDAVSVSGNTIDEDRTERIEAFRRGEKKVLISKGKLAGYGLNLQIATKHIFSGVHDSWELWHQCIKRSNRYGSTEPLDVYAPLTSIELPMFENVLRKARRIREDTAEQERLFREMWVN